MKLQRIFHQPTATEVLEQQLREADRLYAEHIAAAEHHAALAGMYRGRAERIRKTHAHTGELRAVR